MVIENIKRRDNRTELTAGRDRRLGQRGRRAVRPLTLTTVAVSSPSRSSVGISGELLPPVRDQRWGIALGASLLVSLTIVPVLAYWFPLGQRSKVVTDPDAP